ncbi:DsbA family protein [Arenibaculum pallidiluteum]|uniref:DsbA family protein n=1 Tax=Arenibaculum pallidiluteum TaxID=2812559 RepID=UPI001A967FB4|nr:DsbA family protein [Arenibaculum pallidiluteum]
MTALTFVHDPLCGWCYGASPLVRAAAAAGIVVSLRHRALFTGANAIPNTAEFAAYAWSHDQRIARLSGVRFSEAYRERIVGNRALIHDSWTTALAKQVVDAQSPDRAVEWFLLVEKARFDEGQDVTDPAVLAGLGTALGIAEDAFRAALAAPATAEAARAERDEAAALCMRHGSGGVPLLLAERGGRLLPVPHGSFLGDPEGLVRALAA